MEFYPQLSRKPISACEPGELIRLRWGSDTYAFLAMHEGKRYLAFLSALNHTAPPRFAPVSEVPEPVLSYGKDWRIEINQDSANVDLSATRFYDHNGVLVLESDRYLLRVEPFRNLGMYHSIYFDIASGALADAPRNPAAIFLKWSLMVPMGGERYKALVSYPAEPKAPE